jgi:hypothetical protein
MRHLQATRIASLRDPESFVAQRTVFQAASHSYITQAPKIAR